MPKRLIAAFLSVSIVVGFILGALREHYQAPFFLGGWFLLGFLFDYTIKKVTGSEHGLFGMRMRTMLPVMAGYVVAFLVAYRYA
ncbi:MAG: hypothetical protein M3R13_09675 [Armatimonadota bacterium]|nr:hypothetical protein [Armatimonadota bacterium]